MAEVLLFHHAHGVTPGVVAFADRLSKAGHTVHVPDLYDGRTFETVQQGVAYADELGEELDARADAAAAALPEQLVYVGMSLGVMSAQRIAQQREGARGAVLLYSFVDPVNFGEAWPAGVPAQIHGMDGDEFFAGDGDIDAARAFVADVEHTELFTYPGSAHLFGDSSLSDYDPDAAELMTSRVLDFLT